MSTKTKSPLEAADPTKSSRGAGISFRGAGPALLVALAIATLGVMLRAKLNFATALAPSMDAAYYPMQAWWLLEHGRPMYDDVPFFFIVNAAVGKLIALMTGMDLGDALLLASRWIDCVAPPLIALPIMLLARAWSNGRAAGLVIGAGVSAAAIANASTLRMLGDFQKNSMALVFLACAAWAVHRAATMPATRGVFARFWPLALFAGLCAFTHVGGFGAASVMLHHGHRMVCDVGSPHAEEAGAWRRRTRDRGGACARGRRDLRARSRG